MFYNADFNFIILLSQNDLNYIDFYDTIHLLFYTKGEIMSVNINNNIFLGRPADKRTTIEELTYDFLDSHNIQFCRTDHSSADTIEDCKLIEKVINAKICKNLFLKNSAKTQYYLLLMDGDKKFDSKVISHQIGSTRLSFADEEDMLSYLKTQPGSVSILCLINDLSNKIKLLIDSDLLEHDYFCCHPCKNTSTLKFTTNDIINKFLPSVNHEFTIVKI